MSMATCNAMCLLVCFHNGHLADYRIAACSLQASNSTLEAKVKQLESEVRTHFFFIHFRILHSFSSYLTVNR